MLVLLLRKRKRYDLKDACSIMEKALDTSGTSRMGYVSKGDDDSAILSLLLGIKAQASSL